MGSSATWRHNRELIRCGLCKALHPRRESDSLLCTRELADSVGSCGRQDLGDPKETKSGSALTGGGSIQATPSLLDIDDDRVRLALEGGGIGLWDRDLQADEVTWSATLYEMFGRDLQAPVTGDTFFEYIHENDRLRVRAHVDHWLENGGDFEDEFQVVREDGEVCWLRARGRIRSDNAGRPCRIFGANFDITEQKRAQESIDAINAELQRLVQERTQELEQIVDQLRHEVEERREAEALALANRERLFSVLNMFPGYVALKDQNYHIRFANDGFLDAFSQPGNHPCHVVQYGLDSPCEDCPMFRVLDQGRSEEWEQEALNGRTYHVRVSPFRDTDGAEVLLEMGVDITLRRRLERQIGEVSDAERRKIGRDLHDTLGQTMTGLSYLIGGLADRLVDKLPEEAASAEQISEAIDQATAQVRALAHGLDPVGLEADGLLAGLRELAASFENSYGIPCTFQCDIVPRLDAFSATNLYCIAREAATNAAKHSRANGLTISLREQVDDIALSVTDDGIGMPASLRESEGMGLSTMRHRANAIGARLRVVSESGKGTTVTCRLRRKAADQEKRP